jgi:hypothetical protein
MWKVTLNGKELVPGRDYELSAQPDGFHLRLLGAYATGQVRAKIDWRQKTVEVEAERNLMTAMANAVDQQS